MLEFIISASEAAAFGLSRYFTGEPCPNGVVFERRVSDRKCVCEACVKGRTISSAARKKRWYDKNAEGQRARSADWHKRNSVKKSKMKAVWKAENADLVRSHHANRRARKLQAVPVWFGEFDELVMREAADLAARREAVTGFPWHVDHMVPLQARKASGLHIGVNVQVIPATMNIQKHNRLVLTQPGEWIGGITWREKAPAEA